MRPDAPVKGTIIIELNMFANFIKKMNYAVSDIIRGLLCRKWHNRKFIMS